MRDQTKKIKDRSWTKSTKKEVDFIISLLTLKGSERILDIACGYGRHSLELARRGYNVVGVDKAQCYIEDALKTAKDEKLNITFICKDILDVNFDNKFDVVLNLADGAIGYFSEKGNLKLFDIISSSLVPNGKHLMGICSGDFGNKHFPAKYWEAGKKSLQLIDRRWDKTGKRMLYHDRCLEFNDILQPFEDKFDENDNAGIRLYTLKELKKILNNRNMKIVEIYGDYNYSTKASDNNFLQVIYSQKIIR